MDLLKSNLTNIRLNLQDIFKPELKLTDYNCKLKIRDYIVRNSGL